MQLLKPTAAQAAVGLRAMKAVALAGDGFGPAATAMVAAAQRTFLGTDLDFEALDPAAPAELAQAFDDPALARQIVQGMVLMAIADAQPVPARMAKIAAFARALDVDEPGLKAIQELAERHMMLFRIDFYRRSHITATFGEQYRRYGLAGLVKGIGGQRGLLEDATIAARYQALGDLPSDSLGHAFFTHCRKHGFAFPGEKQGFPEAGVFHDFTHVLSGYGTGPDGEVQVGAFQAAYMKDNPYFVLLFVMLTFGAGLNVTPVPQPEYHSTLAMEGLAERFFEALERGSKVRIDLSKGWDHWAWVEKPLDSARLELGIEPPQGGYLYPPNWTERDT